MNYTEKQENNILLNTIPQKYPFIFIDKILKKSKELFTTSVELNFLKEYFDEQGCISDKFPMSLLIEHASQSMFLHGYYLGKQIEYWDYTYKPIGVLMRIDDIIYHSIDIEYSDTLITTTRLIKSKQKLIQLEVITKSKQKGNIIFQGKLTGMFIKESKMKNLTFNKNIDTVIENNNCLKFYNNKDGIDIFSSTYWFLQGHFPGFPCIPGCFLVDGYIQSCGKDFSIKKIKTIRFKHLATPENIYVYKTEENDNTKTFQIINLKDNSVCTEGVIMI